MDDDFWDDATMTRWEHAVDELFADFTGQRQPPQDPIRSALAAKNQPRGLSDADLADDRLMVRHDPETGRIDVRHPDLVRDLYRRSR